MRSPCAEAEATIIRRARADEAARLTAIAFAAKRHWGYPARWLRLWRDDLTVEAEFVRRAPVYCALIDGTVVGFYALSGGGSEPELEHMWVDPDYMRRGIGAALFAHALGTVARRHGRRLRIAADPHAEGFYRRLGAQRIGMVPSRPRGRELPLLSIGIDGADPRRAAGSPARRDTSRRR